MPLNFSNGKKINGFFWDFASGKSNLEIFDVKAKSEFSKIKNISIEMEQMKSIT